MRTLLICSLAAALLSGCSSDSPAGGSSGSSGTSSSSGGTDGSVASGTASLDGGGAFAVGAAYFSFERGVDGGADTSSAQIALFDVPATCPQVLAGVNDTFRDYRDLVLIPRHQSGALVPGHYSYDPNLPRADFDLGIGAISSGSAPRFPSGFGVIEADLTTVTDDELAGSFQVNWAQTDAGTPAPLQGTFDVPRCGASP